MNTRTTVRSLKIVLWVGALLPTAWIVAGALRGWLGVNPIEKVTHVTGLSTLILLLVTLAITPLRRLTGWNPIIQLRRPVGLFAFYYASVHFLIWMVLDLNFEFSWITEDIRERPFITVGFTAFVLLIPLAVTSTKASIRRLGRRWTTIHRLVYVSAVLGVVHFYWLVKSDTRLPLLLGTILALLLLARIPLWLAKRRRRTGPKASARVEPASVG